MRNSEPLLPPPPSPVVIERMGRVISFGHIPLSLKNISYDITITGLVLNVFALGQVEPRWGRGGRGSSLGLSMVLIVELAPVFDLFGPPPSPIFLFFCHLQLLPFPNTSNSEGGPSYFCPGRQMTLCWISTPPRPPAASPWAAADGRGTLPSLGPHCSGADPIRTPAGPAPRVSRRRPERAPPHLPPCPLPTSPATCSSSFWVPPRSLAAPDP